METAILQPKNKEQEEAIAGGQLFLEKGDPNEFYIIVGKAGTGKTTIAQAIVAPYVNKKSILVCALSHKAKLVISEKLRDAFGDDKFVSKSVAGALGMNMDAETGLFTLQNQWKNDPPIKKANIIIVDEASMINEESHELIMREKKKKARVIYLGDIRQLPPIRENGSEFFDKPSPVFYGPNRSILTERIRQGEESPILPFADFFGDNSRRSHPLANPAGPDSRKNIVNDKGALVFADDIEEVIETFLPLYQYAIDNKDMNVIKTVTYRNDTRREINELVRTLIFGFEKAPYVVGDLLMFQDNYSVSGLDEPISNSFEIQVTNVEFDIDQYKVWKLEFIHESKPCSILVLDSSEIKRHAADVTKKFDYAKSLPFGTEERADALGEAWGLKNRYAPIDYAYAITSHKSQGSTYNTVIVDERDIRSVTMINNKAKSQSMYTALTRASTTCVVIDGQVPDESLYAALNLSKNALI